MAPLELHCPGKVLWISCSDTLLTVRKEVTLSGTNLDWLHPSFLTQEIFYLVRNFKGFYCKEKGRKKSEKKELCCFGEVVLYKCFLLSFPVSWRWKFWAKTSWCASQRVTGNKKCCWVFWASVRFGARYYSYFKDCFALFVWSFSGLVTFDR